ncbi:MAG: S8 family serine peptidase [Solirubrobacterales bacterium]|nr:S8 family serine peptidase [Solirubrobacterales bacterium]
MVSALIGTASVLPASAHAAAPYVPGQVIVGYSGRPVAMTSADLSRRSGIRAAPVPSPAPGTQVLKLPSGVTVPQAVSWLRKQPGVAYAVPNFIAHVAGAFYPNDQGRTHRARGWENVQWNFLSGAGVNAPQAWANLIADHRPGARGVVVAVLDTGVAYRRWHQFRRSPDFAGTHFVHPYDFVAHNRAPVDREGHGTFVSGVIAESTNNKIGVTGLAYGASIMPVRILDADGSGDAATISRGIRYAASHGARVINLSLEFSLDVGAGDIPDIISAIRYAHDRGTMVVAAAGNEGAGRVAYPARDADAVSVGATTTDRCLAFYSNMGSRLDLVAPGGDNDASLSDPHCNPNRTLPDITQMTFNNPSRPRRFSLPGGWFGTSMSAPHVAAAAALVIASGLLGRHPSPDRVLAQLKATATTLGGSKPNGTYGYGLLNAGAATSRVAR